MVSSRASFRITLCLTVAAAFWGCSFGDAGIAPRPFVATSGKHPESVDSTREKPTLLLYLPMGQFYVYDFKARKQLANENKYTVVAACSDRKGNVYGLDGFAKIWEFGAGTLNIVKTLVDYDGESVGCSVNPRNGDLAVTNSIGEDGDPANVLIYSRGASAPKKYNLQERESTAGYNPNGDLFVDGEGSGCKTACLEELPYGSSSFRILKERGFTTNEPAAVEWDGKYVGVGDESCGGSGAFCIREVSVSGRGATLVQTVTLATNCGGSYSKIVGWANHSDNPNDLPSADNRRVLAVDLGCRMGAGMGIWRYPEGGYPIRDSDWGNGSGPPLLVRAVWK